MPLVQIFVPSVGVATFHDARRSLSDETRFAVAIGDRLREIAPEGTIDLLTGYSQAERIMISSGLPLKRFHIIYGPGEEEILGPLPEAARYLVIGKVRTAESKFLVDRWLSRMDELLRFYRVAFEDSHQVLLERRQRDIPR